MDLKRLTAVIAVTSGFDSEGLKINQSGTENKMGLSHRASCGPVRQGHMRLKKSEKNNFFRLKLIFQYEKVNFSDNFF